MPARTAQNGKRDAALPAVTIGMRYLRSPSRSISALYWSAFVRFR
ncbi:MAG: hypothetical protein JWM26_4503 [Betaproteobacteria bacterium]|nr:hypothetical protein [Betaproteobacteria bacterium]